MSRIASRKSSFVIAAILILTLAFSLVAVGASNGGQGHPTVISALGIAKVQGETVLVDVIVVVPAGQNANEAARRALEGQGARPFDSANLGSEGFTLTGLVWDNLPVVQNYNPGSSKTEDEPASLNGNGQTALTNTHTAWDGVTTSSFDINFGGTTDRCPSLVRECRGRQFFDGNNDVAWLKLGGSVLGVTWFSTSRDEADIALNTNFDWANDFDAETVFLHENGHTVGLSHSDDTGSVMQTYYHGVDRDLGADDEEGATYLYDNDITGSVSGTVTDGTTAIAGATVVLEGTGLSATTDGDGNYTISSVPDPVTYTVTASANGFGSATISRLTVNGGTAASFTLTATGGDDDGGGGLTGTLDVNIAVSGTTFVNKDIVTITITVTQNGSGVGGVAVHTTIVTPNTKSNLAANGTTDANGVTVVSYKVNSKRDKTGTYHVHAEASIDQASGECLEADACHKHFEVTS